MTEERIRDVLRILDLDGDEQFWAIQKELRRYGYKKEAKLYDEQELSLADSAFRMRDEAVKREDGNWCEAEYQIYDYLGRGRTYDCGLDTYFAMYSQPVHWIIAAIIAKILGEIGDKTRNRS